MTQTELTQINESRLAGCILKESSVIYGLDGLVTADDFLSDPCRAVYEAAKAIKEEGGVVELSSVAKKIKEKGIDIPVHFFTDLDAITPTATNFAYYAQQVAEDAQRRRIQEAAKNILDDQISSPEELGQKLQQVIDEQKARSTSGDSFLELFKPISEFDEQEAEWLIPGWIPKGQITLIVADGGVGKTTLWVNIVAALSSGRACILDPPGFTRKPEKVAFCTTEDSVKKKLRKKLREAGANMENVIAMDLSGDKTGELSDFKFGSDKMKKFVNYVRPVAAVFDPIQGFVPPDINMGSRNAMRDCMAPLIALGEDVGTTFLVVCHTNKKRGVSGRDRVSDSSDLWDIARSVIMAGYTENQGVRYLSNEKNNYTALQETVLFSINSSGQIVREGTTWKRDKDYVMESLTARSAPKKDDCKDFILQTLQAAPDQRMKSDDLIRKAQEFGYAYDTIKRSRKEMIADSVIENTYEGTKGKKGRVCFVSIKGEELEQLPFDTPVPFEGVS